MEKMFCIGFLLSLMTILSAEARYNPRNDEVFQRESEDQKYFDRRVAPDFYQKQQFDYESARSNPRYLNFKRSHGFPQENQFDNQYYLNPTHRAFIENENNFRREDPREYYLRKKSLSYDERDMFDPQVPLIPSNDHQDQKKEKETIEKDAALGKSETLLKNDSEKNQSQVITKELLNKDSNQVLNQDSTITLDSLRDSIIQGVVNTVMNREDETVKSVISDELIKKVHDFVRISGNKEKENNDATKIKEKNDPDIANKEVAKDQINKNQQNLQEIKGSAVNNTEKLDSKEISDKFENLFYESKRDLNPEVKFMYQKDVNAIKKEKKVSASNQLYNPHDNYKDEIESDNNDNLKERRVILNDLKIRGNRKPVFIRERDDSPSFMPGSRQQQRKDFERRRFQQNEVNNEDEDEEYQDFESTARI